VQVIVNGVGLSFGEVRVLDAVDLALEPGECVALVGPSGSGKSTLLGVVGGLIPPDEGSVHRLPVGSPLVTWITQTTSVLARRSVLDNVRLGLYATGTGPDEAIESATRALTAVGLEHLAQRRASSLSGGERQRLVVARALIAQPGLVLADEPTAQLDRQNADAMVDSLIDNRPRETTVVIATHDPLVAARCDRVLRIESGTVLER
jgi:ABC-type lipoprotein export system ATPase subunit